MKERTRTSLIVFILIMVFLIVVLSLDGPEKSSSESATNTSTEKAIPGLWPVDVYGNLTKRGFKKKMKYYPSEDGIDGFLYWDLSKKLFTVDKFPYVTYRVELFGQDANGLYKIEATIMNFTAKKTSVYASSFFAFLANIPYDGANPKQAAMWVKMNINRNASIRIGSVEFIMRGKGNDNKAKILVIEYSPSKILISTPQETVN